MDPTRTMSRRSLGDEVASLIRSSIFEGQLKPGERVPQDQIAEAVGVSRIPVREALIMLESEGWVTIEMHKGAYVNALNDQTVRDHFELLGLIYSFAARRAVGRLGGEVAAPLGARARDVREATTAEELRRAAMAFNAAVIDAAASPRVSVLLRAMPVLVPAEFFDVVPDAVASTRTALGRVARAIRGGDADAAAEAYIRLMAHHGELVVALFQRRGLFST